MPRLTTSTQILRRATSFSERQFGKRQNTAANEYPIHVVFTRANAPQSFPHRLGFKPAGYTVIARRIAPALGVPPGQVWDKYPWATKTHVTLWCDVIGTRAEIVLR